MLSIEELDNKLIIKENPSKLWIFIVLFFIPIWAWGFSDFNGIFAGIVGVLSFVFIFIILLVRTKNEININNKTKELIIYRKGLFSFSTEHQVYKFDDLAETIEFEKRRVGRSENYFAFIKKTNGKKVELFDSGEFSEDKFFLLFKLSNQYFIGLNNKDFQLPII